MYRVILVWAVSCGLLLAATGNGPCQEPSPLKRSEIIVVFIKVVEESADKRVRQTLSEPTLSTDFGHPTSFLVGASIPDGEDYLDVGQRYDIAPIKLSGETLLVEIRSTLTDYEKDDQGKLQESIKKQVTKSKLQLGKTTVFDSIKWKRIPKTSMHLECRFERMTIWEFDRQQAQARAAAEAKKDE